MIADELLALAGKVKELEQKLHESEREARFLKLRLKKLQAEAPEERQETPPWEVLGVSPTATVQEIQAAFRKLSKQHHPDTAGGNRESFEALVSAKSAMLGALK